MHQNIIIFSRFLYLMASYLFRNFFEVKKKEWRVKFKSQKLDEKEIEKKIEKKEKTLNQKLLHHSMDKLTCSPSFEDVYKEMVNGLNREVCLIREDINQYPDMIGIHF